MPLFGPLNHFDYHKLDRFCACEYCAEWRESGKQFLTESLATSTHLKACSCQQCKNKYTLRADYIRKTNRRDVYSESSFHAAHEPQTLGERFMVWLKGEMVIHPETARQDNGFWEVNASKLPLLYWMEGFTSSQTLAPSGAF